MKSYFLRLSPVGVITWVALLCSFQTLAQYTLTDADVGLGESINDEGEVTLDAGSGYESYSWSTGDDAESITVSESSEYWV